MKQKGKRAKKTMHSDTFDPKSDSKYANKKKKQRAGNFSKHSPFK